MNTGVLKVVLDTNVVVSMIGRASPNRWIFDKIITGELRLCVSSEIVLEYEEVLARKTNSEVASNFVEFLTNFPYVEHFDVHFQWKLMQEDPDDNKFIDCAVSANAFCIVSEDRHFKPYKNLEFPPLKILTISEFKAVFS
ncbi:MAG: putative toxin-antitoxin system toxin component, PIN family [Saprospiraceae bacterium]